MVIVVPIVQPLPAWTSGIILIFLADSEFLAAKLDYLGDRGAVDIIGKNLCCIVFFRLILSCKFSLKVGHKCAGRSDLEAPLCMTISAPDFYCRGPLKGADMPMRCRMLLYVPVSLSDIISIVIVSASFLIF